MNPPSRLRLGTRKSALALAQSGQVAASLERAHPGLEVELVPIVTRGDTTPGDLSQLGGKGLFTEELEARLLDGSLDLAVHSLKDLPVVLPQGLTIAAHPERIDARDVLVSREARNIDELPQGARVLTGSLRRKALLLLLRPDLEVVPLRGNIDTRLRKWKESGADGLILAAAGLDRMRQAGQALDDGVPVHRLDPTRFVPAPGQGILALETASGSAAARIASTLADPVTGLCAAAERAVVADFGADCTLPLAAWCRKTGPQGDLTLDVVLALPDASRSAVATASGRDPLAVARECCEALRAEGAEEILATLRR